MHDPALVCVRESDRKHVCPTKLLWTRVRMSIIGTLRETTLADLLAAPLLPNGGALEPLDIHPLTTGA